MGVSWCHSVWFVCDQDESEYVNNLPDRVEGMVGDTPVLDQKVSHGGHVVYFTSSGYNIYDLFDSNFPRPESWTNVIHRISPCQGQDFDVVDWVGRDEFEDQLSERDEDQIEWDYNPLNEYTDPGSDYWTEGNPHLNILSEKNETKSWLEWRDEKYPDSHPIWESDDLDEDEMYDEFRETFWYDYVSKTQSDDIQKGLDLYTKKYRG